MTRIHNLEVDELEDYLKALSIIFKDKDSSGNMDEDTVEFIEGLYWLEIKEENENI